MFFVLVLLIFITHHTWRVLCGLQWFKYLERGVASFINEIGQACQARSV